MKVKTIAQWMNLQICDSTLITFIVRINWAYPTSASGSYSRQADELQVDFKIELFKVLQRHSIITALLMHFSCLSSGKAYCKACFKVQKLDVIVFLLLYLDNKSLL